ncbi:hypothetical protein QAD02_012230 [Eretmocerus hayati]|uniref:Uncharacterized protein n=1 Tax=Eretmocerus hayati TaxID=131215 RepID=A0ACC2NZZ4_9HYME|nr:hypothetical protein QAD02_012230 [Eretmocerus hayati]
MMHDIIIPFEEELKKNSELKKTDVEQLQDWCRKQPHLPKISDSELALFLHSNCYMIEPTKVTIDTFYSIRTHAPEIFSNRDVRSKELQNIFKAICIIPLEGFTREGYTVIMGRLLDPNPTNYVYNDHLKYLCMCMDLWMYENGTTNGHVILLDMTGVSFGHATRLNATSLKKFLNYLQDGLPVRLKAMHFININHVMEMIMNIMKPLMKNDLLGKLHLHSTMESVDKFIPLENLPNELGGKAGTLSELHRAQMKKLEDCRDWFLEEERRARVDETKRPDKRKRQLLLQKSTRDINEARAVETRKIPSYEFQRWDLPS